MTDEIKQRDTGAADETQYHYQSGLSRRQSLKLLAALAASTMLPTLSGCDSAPPAAPADTAGNSASQAAATTEHWPELNLKPITAKGYGTDPNMILPPESPWPLTMSAPQLTDRKSVV